ncbi:MAG: protoporphyrinogen oxidase [Mariprofundus sp.]|nr:protoporphyrinogen oxidase [Mariprofundus sp.]
MSGHDRDVLIIGGGISGLANAWWLAREGLSVEVWEAEHRVGGKIKSSRQKGYLTERAAAMVMNFRPEVAGLVHETGLEDVKTSRMPIAEARRYLLHQGDLKALPMRLGAMLASPIWSARGKLRLLFEPFILTSGGKDESVSDFVCRRFGREVLEKAMEPFVSGTLAADPDQTSAEAALPRLTALEKRYGSITAGILINRILRRRTACVTDTFSFRGGISTLVNVLARAPGINTYTGHRVEELVKQDDGWFISAKTADGHRSINVQHVIVSTPAPAAAVLLKPLDKELAELLGGIDYAAVTVVHAGMDRGDIGHPLDGTGFLTPRREGHVLTGNLWMSSLFPDRAPEGKVLLTSYLGGARSPQIKDWDDDRMVDEMLRTLRPLLGLKGMPEMLRINRHKQALPLYHGAYQSRMQSIISRLKNLPGLHLEANYKGGVSVRDRLACGRSLAQQVVAERQRFCAGRNKNANERLTLSEMMGTVHVHETK